MVQIISIDPLGEGTSHLVPELSNRILLLATTYSSTKEANEFTRRVFARLCLDDDSVILLAAIEEGQIVGHAIGEIQVYEDKHGNEFREVFVWQVVTDPGHAKIVDKFIEVGDNWGRTMKANRMRLMTHRVTGSIAMTRRYGFKPIMVEMERPINGR